MEEAISYVLANQTRTEIRAILNDGARSREELARLTNETTSCIGWHVSELRADGTIELCRAERVGSAVKHYYRAVEIPSCGEEEIAAMPPGARRALIGVALQASLSEALAAFWAGRMVSDPNVVLAWRWFNVDGQGRDAIADEQTRSLARLREIATEAFSRNCDGGPSMSIVVSSLAYARSRFSPCPPAILLDPIEGAMEVALRLGRGERSVEEAISYAISDKLRIEILTILNEGDRTSNELASLMGETPDKIKHHLRELLDEGSIELGGSARVGNVIQHYYRAIRMPSYSAEEITAMSPESRQAIVGVTLQGAVAEAISAFGADTIIGDPRFRIASRSFRVDAQGREELTSEQERSWTRMQEIEAEALNRVADSGEQTKSINVTSLGFVHSRHASPGKAPVDPDEFVRGGIDLGSQANLAQVQ